MEQKNFSIFINLSIYKFLNVNYTCISFNNFIIFSQFLIFNLLYLFKSCSINCYMKKFERHKLNCYVCKRRRQRNNRIQMKLDSSMILTGLYIYF